MSDDENLRQWRALMRALGDRIDRTIYHYTSAEGFRGIVANSEIWLTNAAFVNDTTECRAFWECAKELLEDGRLSNESVQDKLKIRLGDRPEIDRYYIASFSKVSDHLQQYRAYGGFCIGFDPGKMTRSPFHTYKCVYRAKDIKDWVCRKSNLCKWEGSCLSKEDKRNAAHNLVFSASVKYKNAAYRDEHEVRMVAVSNHKCEWSALLPLTMPLILANDPPIHFRDHPDYGMPIPYVKFFIPAADTKKNTPKVAQRETMAQMKRRKLREEAEMSRGLLPITEVWIGPMARQKEAKLACEILLQEKGYENVGVQASKIPYRGF